MKEPGDGSIVVVLHNIRSLHNVGSIFRTADAAGVEKIYLCGITPKPVDRFGAVRPQFAKVALGAEKYVPWEYARRTADVIKKLRHPARVGVPTKSPGAYKIFAVEQGKKSIPYHELKIENWKLKIALIFGNERTGLPPSILKFVDKILEIPMRGALIRQAHHPRRLRHGKESLNVAVAFGIVVFDLMKPPGPKSQK